MGVTELGLGALAVRPVGSPSSAMPRSTPSQQGLVIVHVSAQLRHRVGVLSVGSWMKRLKMSRKHLARACTRDFHSTTSEFNQSLLSLKPTNVWVDFSHKVMTLS